MKKKIQIQMHTYLKDNLSVSTLAKFGSIGDSSIQEILEVLSDWVYEERASLLVRRANEIAHGRANANDYEDVTDSFMDDLKKL